MRGVPLRWQMIGLVPDFGGAGCLQCLPHEGERMADQALVGLSMTDYANRRGWPPLYTSSGPGFEAHQNRP
jgi:hypothetical protein